MLSFAGVLLQFEQELMTSRASQEKLQRMVADAEARADAASTQVCVETASINFLTCLSFLILCYISGALLYQWTTF